MYNLSKTSIQGKENIVPNLEEEVLVNARNFNNYIIDFGSKLKGENQP